MGLSGTGFCIMTLAAFPLALPLHSVCSCLQAISEVPSMRSSSAMVPLGLGLGSQCRVGLGHEFSGPTIAPQNPVARLLVGEEGFGNVGLAS